MHRMAPPLHNEYSCDELSKPPLSPDIKRVGGVWRSKVRYQSKKKKRSEGNCIVKDNQAAELKGKEMKKKMGCLIAFLFVAGKGKL